MRAARYATSAAALAVVLLTACSPMAVEGTDTAPGPAAASTSADPTPTDPSPTPSAGPTSPSTTTTPPPTPTPTPTPTPRPVLAGDGKPREARLSIPALDIERLRVRPYRGSPDDARGTEIQDGGIAASPHGPKGGTGAGGLGNYIVTAHRTSSTRAFARLPRLENGAEVEVVAGGRRYTYRIVDTRITSFRSKRSLARQAAAVPGRVGVEPTRAMITLSTCRTQEDHAEGNYWSDRFGNPEHRIDKIGVLVAIDAV
jgi:sortase A